jgi:hypothetical protein
MNRTILIVAGVFGASSPVLVDSAVKCTALLVVAAVAALILRRDSAATRHLVWLLAMAAMLVVRCCRRCCLGGECCRSGRGFPRRRPWSRHDPPR